MCKYIFNLVFILAHVGGSAPAMAQLDSSSAILLRSKSRPTSPENLDTARYKIRMPEPQESPKDEEELEEKPGTVIPSPVPLKAAKATPPVVSATAEAPIISPPPAPVTPTQAPENPPLPPVTTQVKELILGGSEEEISEYRKQIHVQDPRANILDISLAPAYYYNDSSSEYSFRRYNSNGPGFGLGMNLWLTPFFGLQSKFFTSVSSSQRSGGLNSVPTELQTFAAGMRFRKHFGYSRKAAHLSWGLDYQDDTNKISRVSETTIGRKSSGLNLALEAVVPNSATYAHTVTIEVRPRLKHSELSTGVDARSGSRNETNALGLSLGGLWTLDRRNQLFWRGQYSVERNLFSGEATRMDPHNDETPDGVSVTNTMMIFQLGFRWGT
jgi:hypothetical protein